MFAIPDGTYSSSSEQKPLRPRIVVHHTLPIIQGVNGEITKELIEQALTQARGKREKSRYIAALLNSALHLGQPDTPPTVGEALSTQEVLPAQMQEVLDLHQSRKSSEKESFPTADKAVFDAINVFFEMLDRAEKDCGASHINEKTQLTQWQSKIWDRMRESQPDTPPTPREGQDEPVREALQALCERLSAKAFPLTPHDTAEPCITLCDLQDECRELAGRAALTFERFSAINRLRCESKDGFNHALGSWSTSDWFLALLGELGEAANVAKKLNRVRDGIPGNKQSKEELEAMLRDELGDSFVYLDLLAQSLNVAIGEAAVKVFNAKSEQIGCPVRIGRAALGQTSTAHEENKHD